MRDLLEWLEDFSERSVDEEVSASNEAPARISREPLHQEPPTIVVLVKHSIYTHFPNDRNCEVCKRTKVTRALAENALVIKYFEQKSLVTAQQQITKLSLRVVNLDTFTSLQWYKISPLNGLNLIRAKTKKEFTKVPRAVGKAKSLTILQNLANPVKTYHGIIVHLRLIVPNQMVLLKEQHAELRKELLLCCYKLAWKKSGVRVPWNVSVMYAMSKTSWQMEQHRMKGVSDNHVKAR